MTESAPPIGKSRRRDRVRHGAHRHARALDRQILTVLVGHILDTLVAARHSSNLGPAAMARYFPPNQTLLDYLLMGPGQDMRNVRDVAVLKAVSVAMAKVLGSTSCPITQPTGSPLKPGLDREPSSAASLSA